MTKREAQEREFTIQAFLRMAPTATREDFDLLRRASRTLRRWFELECGNSNDYGSWAIERDETTGVAYEVRHHYRHGAGEDTVTRTRIADRETPAAERIAQTCDRLGLHFHIQTDPRGAALYVHTDPLTDSNYNRGLCIY